MHKKYILSTYNYDGEMGKQVVIYETSGKSAKNR